MLSQKQEELVSKRDMLRILKRARCLQLTGLIKLNGNMDLQQLKLYIINASTLGVTTFTKIEMGLKIILLSVTIGAGGPGNMGKSKKKK